MNDKTIIPQEVYDLCQRGIRDSVKNISQNLESLTQETDSKQERCAICGNTKIYKYDDYCRPICERCANGGGRTYVRSGDKIGRNEPCPCGSGLKYKKCCGK